MRTWKHCLEDAGFPSVALVLDFETYTDGTYHLGRDKDALSTVEYVVDERFEILGLGISVLNHPWEKYGKRFVPADRVPQTLERLKTTFGCALQNCTVACANTKFDTLILAEKYNLYPPYAIDVQDLVRYYDARLPTKLSKSGPYFGFASKGDTLQFRGKHFSEIDLNKLSEYTLTDIEITEGLMKKLLPIIHDPKLELRLMRHTLDLYRKPKIHYDFLLAADLKARMTDVISDAIEDVKEWVDRESGVRNDVQHQLSGDISFVKLLLKLIPEVPTKPGKPTKNMKPLTGEGRIPALAKTDDGLRELLNHTNNEVRLLAQARVAVSSWPNHIKRISKMEKQARASNGLMRVPLKYYGAHTGRWSGEEQINLGNLGGSGRGKEINKLISQVRHTLRAKPGWTFILCDAAQVEARDLARYAKQTDLVAGFRRDEDIYSAFASELFQTRVWKPSEEEKSTPEGKKAEIFRGFGKDAILGCGYGMGAKKFYERCCANETLRPFFDSGEYDFNLIERLIETYRTKYSCIPNFWKKLERAWRVATRYDRKEDVDAVSFWHKNCTTFMRLPSGRIIRYRDARVDRHDDLYSSSCISQINPRGKLWGGTLTENLIQATCRDYLVWWIAQIEDETNMPVVHHVYDETITMVPEVCAKKYQIQIETIMSTGPSWAADMPFKAESTISPYYKK